jgi:hypothetical protein
MSGIPATLRPGTEVGHANPELAGWAGTVTAGSSGWQRPDTGDVWVAWHAGTTGRARPAPGAGGLPATGWIEATALTLKGSCPACARPAHYLLAGNFWDRSVGWHHDSPADMATCWAGKAAYERGRPGNVSGRPASAASTT